MCSGIWLPSSNQVELLLALEVIKKDHIGDESESELRHMWTITSITVLVSTKYFSKQTRLVGRDGYRE